MATFGWFFFFAFVFFGTYLIMPMIFQIQNLLINACILI